MSTKRLVHVLCAMLLLAGSAFGQATTGNILGTVTDPGDASIPGVEVQLRNLATGETRTTTTGNEGIFRFNNVQPGAYTITMKAQSGFKAYTQTGINLSSAENRDLGKVKLALGSLTEEISVTASVTPVQTASSERSSLVDGNQLNQIAIRGRDMLAMLNLIPGVISTNAGETTSENSIGGVNINGAGTGRNNFTVDGVTNLDTGSNGTSHYNPNMDAVAEIRVLTTNYQAEYGRMASGQISVITKGGGQEFHGSAFGTYRHESLNATNFFTNIQGNRKPIYRYWIGGFGVGGPVYIPKLFNTDKRKVFFFVSQEYTKQRPTGGTTYLRVPTALERQGDFSQSIDPGTNKTYVMYDPTTRAQLSEQQKANIGAFITDPAAASWGQAMMNYFPLPNRCDLNGNAAGCYTEGDATQLHRRNYKYDYSGKHPRRNDVIRFDTNLTSKLTAFYRFVNDYDLSVESFSTPRFSQATDACKGLPANQRTAHPECWQPYSEDHPNPGKGHGIGITYTISPTMVNEFTFGKSYNTWSWYPHDETMMDRMLVNNPPHWFDEKGGFFATDKNLARPTLTPGHQNFAFWVPQINGGSTSNSGTARPYTNWNDIYSFSDSISYVRGSHSFKAGLYYERTGKVQQGGTGQYLGSFNFSGGPKDLGRGDANMFLGNLNNYSEGARIMGDFWFTGIEWYVQDNWRVNRRLTLDLGVRFYYLKPQENLNNTSAMFVLENYNPAKAARLYQRGCAVPVPATSQCPSAQQRAMDPLTGALTVSSLVGTFVPGSGDYFSGNTLAGSSPKVPLHLWDVTKFAPAPRVGLAWDVFGDGKTAIRTGFGQTFQRGDGNQIMGPFAGVPPITYNRTIYYLPITQVQQSADIAGVGPISNGGILGKQKYETVYSTSFGIQQNIGFGTVLDASYVGSFRRHILQSRPLNTEIMWSEYDPQYMDPWSTTTPKRAISDDYRRPLKGISGVTTSEFRGTTTYNAFQLSVRRNTRGFSYGLAYTFHKIMSPGSIGGYDHDPELGGLFRTRRSSSSFNGAPHILVMNYIYDLPKLGQRFNNKPLGWITDNWTISGITQFQGPFFNNALGTYSWSNTNNTTYNPMPQTGGDEGARSIVLRNATVPNDKVTWNYFDWTQNNTFDYAAFAQPLPCSWTPNANPKLGIGKSIGCFGNAGSGPNFKIPLTYNNWDVTLAKRIPLGAERRELTFRAEAYNLFNHTQFDQLNTSPTYDYRQYLDSDKLVQTNNQLGRFTRARTERRIALSLRLQF